MGLADGFAVPAGTFGVGFAVLLLVGFACPGEGVVQGGFGDFVVVVDELACFPDGVVHIDCW